MIIHYRRLVTEHQIGKRCWTEGKGEESQIKVNNYQHERLLELLIRLCQMNVREKVVKCCEDFHLLGLFVCVCVCVCVCVYLFTGGFQ